MDGSHSTAAAALPGRLPLTRVLDRLAARRPVFHSEADFQFEFARTLADLDPSLQIRLEVPHRDPKGGTRYVDLVCYDSTQRTLVEFKYVTRYRTWTASDGEEFHLKNHAAMDLARLHVVHDVHRLEALTSERDSTTGIALLLTNVPALWQPPTGRRETRDAAFRLHEGRPPLIGTLTWGPEGSRHQGNQRTLTGTYPTTWHDYTPADAPGAGDHFRWLAFYVPARESLR